MAIDLEHFPISETARRMMERISPIYGRAYVGKWIFQVMGMELDEARALFLALRDEAFPERTTWTIDYWERRYAIVPKPTETIEERRRNIRMKQSLFLPMNPARLEGIIDNMSGGETTITENVDDYTFSVNIENPGPGMDAVSIIKEIRQRKPSHQNFIFYVTLRAKKPATLHVGGGVGSVVHLGVPQEADTFCFRHSIHVGGVFGANASVGVPPGTGTFHFRRTLPVGGVFGTGASIGIPAGTDKYNAETILRAGGAVGIYSVSGVPIEPDKPEFSGSFRAGGTVTAQASFPVPEDTAQPPTTTILRTGGVCTIISNISKGE